MTEKTVTTTTCNECGTDANRKESWRALGGSWVETSITSGFCGPHPSIGMPNMHGQDDPSQKAHLCSPKCLIDWLQKQIDHVKAVGVAYAERAEVERKRWSDKPK